MTVLDASAFLAFLQDERGADVVRLVLAKGCVMSSVNWSEVLSKVAELGHSSQDFVMQLRERSLLGNSLQIVAFEEDDAPLVGDLRPLTRSFGLSLGDRACLALGRRLGQPILTADRAWADLSSELGLEIQLIR